MAEFKVLTSPTAPSRYKFEDGGEMDIYTAELEGEGEVKFWRPVGTALEGVKQGATINGTVKPNKSGKSFKFTPKDNSGGSKGGGYNDPETVARITRSHSQEMALRFIATTGDAKELDLENTDVVKAYLNGHVKRLTDWFDRDVQGVSPPSSQPPLDQSSSDAPADTAGLNEPQKTDESIPF